MIHLHSECGGRVENVVSQTGDGEVVDAEADQEHGVAAEERQPGGRGEYLVVEWNDYEAIIDKFVNSNF